MMCARRGGAAARRRRLADTGQRAKPGQRSGAGQNRCGGGGGRRSGAGRALPGAFKGSGGGGDAARGSTPGQEDRCGLEGSLASAGGGARRSDLRWGSPFA